MLRSLNALHGYTALAKDAYIGSVQDFYFHDDTWIIRYFVLDTRHWLLDGRRVLVTTRVIGKPNWAVFTFPVAITRERVEKSPEIQIGKPVSRQFEAGLHNHYGWPFYWTEPELELRPQIVLLDQQLAPGQATKPASDENFGPNLRSAEEVAGYYIHATDGALGHVEDFVADDEGWVIRYLAVHTGVFGAKKVLISPQWLGKISYSGKRVYLKLTRAKILKSPGFVPGGPIDREYEERLYDYYGQPAYWVEGDMAIKPNQRIAECSGVGFGLMTKMD